MMRTVSLKAAATILCLAPAAFSAPAAAQSVDVAAAPFNAQAIDDASLGAIAGREDTVQHATSQQTAGVVDNSVGDNVRTGDATIDGNAFQNLSGLSILNVNTGNNVAINAAMNVNIAINPGP
jgi:hypothetical protein